MSQKRRAFLWINNWVNKFYELDNRRKSLPASKFVYNALKLTSKRLSFPCQGKKKKAMEEADLFLNLAKLKSKQKKFVKNIKRITNKEINTVYNCAINALNNLTFSNDIKGIFAGLPLVFPVLDKRRANLFKKALCLIGQNDFAKQLLIAH